MEPVNHFEQPVVAAMVLKVMILPKAKLWTDGLNATKLTGSELKTKQFQLDRLG